MSNPTEPNDSRQPDQVAPSSGPSAEPEPTLHAVTMTVCSLCLEGAGGECHTPGCVFIYHDAPAPKNRGATLRQLLTGVGTVDGKTEAIPDRANTCERCDLPLSGWTEPTDCRYCDRLCPVFGTHGHLWTGDEDESWDRYVAAKGGPIS
jgi:hypothetical protein